MVKVGFLQLTSTVSTSRNTPRYINSFTPTLVLIKDNSMGRIGCAHLLHLGEYYGERTVEHEVCPLK